jgi:hypothetical protein
MVRLRAGWPVLAVLLLSVPAFAQSRPPASEITFVLKDTDRSASWPVEVRTVTVDGSAVRVNAPVRVGEQWFRNVAITLRNISPKTIVTGGIGIVFPESGDGSSANPYGACWSAPTQVPKLVWLGRDGVYHLPPGWDQQKPLHLLPGASIRLPLSCEGEGARLAGKPIHQAVLTFETFYFADNSRWSAEQYALPPLPGTRQWRMVSRDEFLRSAKSNP